MNRTRFPGPRRKGHATQAAAPARLVSGAVLAAYVETAKRVEIDPYAQLRRARLPSAAADWSAVRAPYARIVSLLSTSAEIADAPDFTLQLVRALARGPLGAARVVPPGVGTLAEGLERLRRGWREHDDGMRLALVVEGDSAVLRLTPTPQPPGLAAAPSELPLGMLLGAVRSIAGQDWRPQACAFVRSRPHDDAAFSELFGDVAFDQDHDAMTFPAADLLRPLATSGADVTSSADPAAAPLSPAPAADLVRAIILELLPGGGCSIQTVGQRLGVDRRTIHRRLAAEGQTFTGLVQSLREASVADRLAEFDGRFGALARLLGFASRSTFSRWFRQTYGATPSQRIGLLSRADMACAGDSASCMRR